MFILPIYLYAPCTFIHPQGCTHTPYAHTLLCICVFLQALHVVGGCNGLPFVLGHLSYTTPVWGCLPFNYSTHTQSLVPCASVFFRDISMLCMHFPSVEGFGGVPPSVGVGFVASALEMSLCSFFSIFYSALCLTFQQWL